MRITLMYLCGFLSLFNHLEKNWETLLNVNQKKIINYLFFLIGLGII